MEVAFDRRIIAAYPNADPAFQQAVQVVAGLALDVPDGVLTYGAIGVWVAVVSAVGLRARRLPPAVCGLGFAAAFTCLAGVVGYAFVVRPLLVLSIGLGGLLLVPAWYAWLGMILRARAGWEDDEDTTSACAASRLESPEPAAYVRAMDPMDPIVGSGRA